jgi:hypothetical protein
MTIDKPSWTLPTSTSLFAGASRSDEIRQHRKEAWYFNGE